jgi:hypothetical protein
MNALAYYLRRKQGLDPAEAREEAEADSAPDNTPPDNSTPDPTPDTSNVQTSAPDDSWDTPDFSSLPPPRPAPEPTAPPMAQASQGISAQLSAALARARTRAPMPADINDDAMAKQLQSDEDTQHRGDLAEALRAAFARQAPRQLASKPSAALQALMQRRSSFDKQAGQDQSDALHEAQILKGAEPKPVDPSLTALHEASAAQLRELAAQRDAREKRDSEETKRKADISASTTMAEAASLEAQKKVLAADPRLKRLGLGPADIAKLDRKGLEDVTRELAGRYGAGSSAASGGGGKRLPAASLKDLGDLDAADTQLAHLEEEASRSNIGSLKNQAVSMLPERGFLGINKANTDIGRYEDSARAAMQAVGVILEHGKLAAGDETKYRRMLPEPGDDAETLHHKITELRGYLRELKAKHSDAYQQGGYSVPHGGGSSGGHGKVVKETKTVRQYEDGFLEEKK